MRARIRRARLGVLLLIAISATAGAVVDRPVDTPVAAVLRKLVAAEKLFERQRYAEARTVFVTAIEMPAFAGLREPLRHRALKLAGFSALETDDPAVAERFLLAATALADADAEDWLNLLLAQVRNGHPAEAVLPVTVLSRLAPQALRQIDQEVVFDLVGAVEALPESEDRCYRLLTALRVADWKDASETPPDELWAKLALLEMQRGAKADARVLIAEIQDVNVLIGVLADKRFDGLTDARPAGETLTQVLDRSIAEFTRRVERRPRDLRLRMELTYRLLQAGGHEHAVIRLADEAEAAVAKARASGAASPFDNADVYLPWMLDSRARALVQLGRSDEALAAYERSTQTERYRSLHLINLMRARVDRGEPAEALAIEWPQDSLRRTDYRLQQLRAAHALGNRALMQEAAAVIAERGDPLTDTAVRASLEMGDEDGAAAVLIQSLQHPLTRSGALRTIQDYARGSMTPVQSQAAASFDHLRARPDVTEAIDRVGRRLRVPFAPPPS